MRQVPPSPPQPNNYKIWPLPACPALTPTIPCIMSYVLGGLRYLSLFFCLFSISCEVPFASSDLPFFPYLLYFLLLLYTQFSIFSFLSILSVILMPVLGFNTVFYAVLYSTQPSSLDCVSSKDYVSFIFVFFPPGRVTGV